MTCAAMLFQIVAQFATAARMVQFAERLCLDLANAFARDAEFLADFFQRMTLAVLEPKAQLQDAPFARRKGSENFLYLLAQELVGGGIRWTERGFVGDEIAQIRVLLFADRHFERQGAL